LLRLDGELTEAQARLAALRTALGTPRPVAASSSTLSTAVEKVALSVRALAAARGYPRFLDERWEPLGSSRSIRFMETS
jgi:hypothetical protein